MRRLILMAGLLAVGCATVSPSLAAPAPTVYVVVWFDTEDYLLRADDDAILRNATFMTNEGLKGTFKVVGEKARVLEQRQRTDVIDALKKHEIGFHSNFHSVHPTPAQYLSALGWDEGMAEFERREGPGWEDVRRIFGQTPSCYGQPGSSWGPQAFGVMKKWGMKAYLDTGSHVSLDGKPHYYCGLLTMFRLTHTLRTGLGGEKDLQAAKEKFDKSRAQLLQEGGGLVSIFYHPCEFVHKQFWDSIFKNGANPPREEWTPPPQKTPEESKVAYETFESWIRYLKSFPDVKFITAGEAAELYRDKAAGRKFQHQELREIAEAVGDQVNYQSRGDYALSPAEIFTLLCLLVRSDLPKLPPAASGATLRHEIKQMHFPDPLYGPSEPGPLLSAPVTTSWSQYTRTIEWALEYIGRHHRIPSTVWLGSTGVPPEAFYTSLAQVVLGQMDGHTPDTVEIRPAKFTVGVRVADDSPKIWGWLFPEGWHAPQMMALARRQAWTIKPAILDASR
jgi:hypothetical protein